MKLLWLAYREQKVFLESPDVPWLQTEHNCDCMSGLSATRSRLAFYLCTHRDLKTIACRTEILVNYAECGNRTGRFSDSCFYESVSIKKKKKRKFSVQTLCNIRF